MFILIPVQILVDYEIFVKGGRIENTFHSWVYAFTPQRAMIARYLTQSNGPNNCHGVSKNEANKWEFL